MLAVVGSLYAFAGKRKLLPVGLNPARGIDKYPEKGRERFLSGDELAKLGDAIREAETVGLTWDIDHTKPTAKHAPKQANRRTVIDPYAAAAIRLLILTGARLREILKLEWGHVDPERGMLLLPDSKTGAKSIILNAPALAVLAGLERIGVYVIAGQSAGMDGEKPRADLNKPWRAVAKRAGLEGVRIHDLRYTHASIGAGAGLGPLSANCWAIRRRRLPSVTRISIPIRCGAHRNTSAVAWPPRWVSLPANLQSVALWTECHGVVSELRPAVELRSR